MSGPKTKRSKWRRLGLWAYSLGVIGILGVAVFFARKHHEETSWPQPTPDPILLDILNDDGTLPVIFDSTEAFLDEDYAGPSPDILWEKVYGGVGYQAPFNLIAAEDGGAFISGHITHGPDKYHVMYLMRVDKSGDQIWAKSYKTDQDSRIHMMRTLSNGDLLLVGETTALDSQSGDIYMVRVNTQGDVIWEGAIENDYNDWGDAIAPLPNGGAWVMGGTTEGTGFQAIRVLRMNADGGVVTEKLIDKYRRQVANAAIVLEDGSLFFAGHATADYRLSDIYYGALSSEGDLIWDELFIWPVNDRGTSRVYGAFPIDENEIYLFGVIETGGENEQDAFISRVTKGGEVIWRHRYGRAEREAKEIAYAGMLTPNGGVLVAGDIRFHYSDRKMYLLCLDQNGTELWNKEFRRTESGGRITSLAMTSDGHSMLTGYEGAEDQRNWYIAKLDKKCP
ncbi:hypothetical protein N9M10_02725 [Hellea sp.]|nr:hypothetical protein [Hellea sp.]